MILVESLDAAVARAVGYLRSIRPQDVEAITFEAGNAATWKRLAPEIPITVLSKGTTRASEIKRFLAARKTKLPSGRFQSLAVPETLEGGSLWEIIRRPRIHRLKAAFLSERDVQIIDLPVARSDIDPLHDEALEPARNHVIVLVAGVHNASLQAIEYAETLHPADLRAVSFGLDPEGSEKLAEDWLSNEVPIPLEIHESPFRDIGHSLSAYIERFEPDGKHRVVTVVIPEFIVRKFRHQLLHGQSALLVKRHLLFQRGVVVASVPYHLED